MNKQYGAIFVRHRISADQTPISWSTVFRHRIFLEPKIKIKSLFAWLHILPNLETIEVKRVHMVPNTAPTKMGTHTKKLAEQICWSLKRIWIENRTACFDCGHRPKQCKNGEEEEEERNAPASQWCCMAERWVSVRQHQSIDVTKSREKMAENKGLAKNSIKFHCSAAAAIFRSRRVKSEEPLLYN